VCSRVAESLGNLMTMRMTFIDTQLFHSDLSQLQMIYLHWSFLCLTSEQRALSPLFSQQLQRLWNVTDLLLNSSYTFIDADDFLRYSTSIAVNVICIFKPPVFISGILMGMLYSLPETNSPAQNITGGNCSLWHAKTRSAVDCKS